MLEYGVRTFYNATHELKDPELWVWVGLQRRADIIYNLEGYAARNAFMPINTLSEKGPGRGGGWIVINAQLQVCIRGLQDRPHQVWAGGRVFAVGDCHYGAVINSRPYLYSACEATTSSNGGQNMTVPKGMFSILPVPKTAMAAVAWAQVASRNIELMQQEWPPEDMAQPSEAGIIAVGLGPDDGVVVWKVNCTMGSGEVVLLGKDAAKMKQRLTWPNDDEEFLANPQQWLSIFQEGVPAGRRFAERMRSALHLSTRAW